MKKITSLFLFVLLLAACDILGGAQSQPPPLSTAIPSLTPVIPTNTEAPPPTPEVVIDKSGPLSDLAIKNIEGGKYAVQVDRLKALHPEWVKQGFISSETNQIVFLEDQNHDPDGVFAALMSRDGSQYIFPPLALDPNKSPVPAYENTRFGLEPGIGA
jgi:hypothetical protein